MNIVFERRLLQGIISFLFICLNIGKRTKLILTIESKKAYILLLFFSLHSYLSNFLSLKAFMSLKNVVNIHCIPLNFIVKMFLKRKKKKKPWLFQAIGKQPKTQIMIVSFGPPYNPYKVQGIQLEKFHGIVLPYTTNYTAAKWQVMIGGRIKYVRLVTIQYESNITLIIICYIKNYVKKL